MKTFGFYSQFMDCPKSLKLHKTIVCTQDEALDLIEGFNSNRLSSPTSFGRMVEFFEEIK